MEWNSQKSLCLRAIAVQYPSRRQSNSCGAPTRRRESSRTAGFGTRCSHRSGVVHRSCTSTRLVVQLYTGMVRLMSHPVNLKRPGAEGRLTHLSLQVFENASLCIFLGFKSLSFGIYESKPNHHHRINISPRDRSLCLFFRCLGFKSFATNHLELRIYGFVVCRFFVTSAPLSSSESYKEYS